MRRCRKIEKYQPGTLIYYIAYCFCHTHTHTHANSGKFWNFLCMITMFFFSCVVILLSIILFPHSMLQMSQLPPLETHPHPLPTHSIVYHYTHSRRFDSRDLIRDLALLRVPWIKHNLGAMWRTLQNKSSAGAPCPPCSRARDSSVMQITSQSAHDRASVQRLEVLLMCVYTGEDKKSSRQECVTLRWTGTSSARRRLRCSGVQMVYLGLFSSLALQLH